MVRIAAGESEVIRSAEIVSNEQLSGEALAEWRSSEQVENGTPSTSPPYWDCDDEEGPKPSELYGKYTWKIQKFSQIKRELRSNAFEIGGYKWYILIYPQGCDVCNHLSLFLCVANHDKLLPGWSHFAQFTIAVVNKDPKKSKYSDTLHRFWKKEHDWGWKKFMELSKVFDGFIDSDTLVIKAQVQVIREKADRPFRCLDRLYRRELVRVYLSNVEQICRRFVEERRGKLWKLIDDRVRWSSFCVFWLKIDQNSKRRMSREKRDVILKVMVKHFFIEKEVTSTLVMDSLYSGLKALEAQNKNKNERETVLDVEETTAPIVRVEKDTFVLVDDIVTLLRRAALEPLPPKDEKGPQNRKDGNTGEDFNKDSVEYDERRLTELGRRTLEMFVLAHIFSNKIEVAYQEAVAFRRQEELIREEEEAAWLAESAQKAKRGGKDKKSKKKQAKQKRNNRKGKEKGIEDKAVAAQQNKHQVNGSQEDNDFANEQEHSVLEKRGTSDNVSEASDSVANEVLQPEIDRDGNWDTDTSEVHPPTESRSRASSVSSVQSGIAEKKNPSIMDDCSSTCSTDSVPSVIVNSASEGNSLSNCINPKTRSRRKNRRGKMAYGGSSSTNGTNGKPSGPTTDSRDLNHVLGSKKAAESEFKCLASQMDGEKCLELYTIKKEIISLANTMMVKDQVDVEKFHDAAIPPSQPRSSLKMPSSIVQAKTEIMNTAVLDPVAFRKASQSSLHQCNKSASPAISSQVRCMPNSETQKFATLKSAEKAVAEAAPVISRPSSAPLVPASRPVPATTVVSMVQTAPLLARSMSAVGRLGPDPAPATHSCHPQSYRNAIIGNIVASSSASHPISSTPGNNSAPMCFPSSSVSASSFVNHNSEGIESNSVKSGSPFSMSSKRTDSNYFEQNFPRSMLTHENLQNGPRWFEIPQRDASRSIHSGQSFCSDLDLNMCSTVNNGSRAADTEILAGTSGRQTQGALVDEFPHLDIINDLLDDEHAAGSASRENTIFQSPNSLAHLFNRQYSFESFPGEIGALGDVGSSTNCRVETPSYHDDVFHRRYPSFGGGLFDTQDFVPHVGPMTYPNGQIDGMLLNQWHLAGSDVSLVGMRTVEADVDPQYNPDYSTLTCGVNGYPVFSPSSERRK